MANFPINTPLGLGDLLDRVFRLYRLHANKMVLAVAIFIVPLGILSALLVQDATASSLLMLRDLIVTGQQPLQQSEPGLWTFLLIPVGFIVQGFVGLVSAQLTIDALHGRVLTVSGAVRTAAGKFFPWLLMVILMGLTMLVIAIVMMIIGFIFVFIFGAMIALFAAFTTPVIPDADMNVSLAIGLGVLLFLLYIAAIFLFISPFLYFYGRWSVSLPVLLAEAQGPVGALGRSWNLTQANGRRAMGYVFLAYLVAFVVVGTPANVLQFVVGLSLPVESQWISAAFISGISTIANVLTSPISSIAYVLFYYELRVRKESYDLALQLSPVSESPFREVNS